MKHILTAILFVSLFTLAGCIEKNQDQAHAAELAGEMQEAMDNGDVQRVKEVKDEARAWFNSLSSEDQQVAKEAYDNYRNNDNGF